MQRYDIGQMGALQIEVKTFYIRICKLFLWAGYCFGVNNKNDAGGAGYNVINPLDFFS